jgi:hypothetical protein
MSIQDPTTTDLLDEAKAKIDALLAEDLEQLYQAGETSQQLLVTAYNQYLDILANLRQATNDRIYGRLPILSRHITQLTENLVERDLRTMDFHEANNVFKSIRGLTKRIHEVLKELHSESETLVAEEASSRSTSQTTQDTEMLESRRNANQVEAKAENDDNGVPLGTDPDTMVMGDPNNQSGVDSDSREVRTPLEMAH